ncbi:ATP-binding protein [Phyllobacterium lublinensis]|uniref:ATP-binding protein n=1 Tax=Phyllobacterium lublinensis TaxID=2875708 RepID=UPI001CCE741C|nr:NB-ARC domain-containing protein [Phyllobacterium sp. 2063]MBZ9653646.1 helix-turn-helix transcriptional regulator [Phyllobacterium sp. 2063]
MGYHARGFFDFGPYRLNPAARVLLRGDELLSIGSRAFDMLVALVQNHGRVLSHAELMAFAWPGLNVEASNIRVQMTHLRREIGCGENGDRYIVSLAGRGYSFVAPVTWEEASQSIQAWPVPLSDVQSSCTGPCIAKAFPPRLSHPIGRDENIEKLSQMVAERRFITIVGAGGVGKTTLAILVAHALRMFEDVRFVDLSTVDDEAAVLEAIASALDTPSSESDVIEDVIGRLSSRRALVILDNCEHVIDAAADVVVSLLGQTGRVHILATSREAFRLPGEAVFLLQPLGVPPHTGRLTAAQALLWPAIQLFVERAVDSGHLEPFVDEQAATIAAICRRLDGNPLAIELVASRMGPYGLDRVVEMLDNQLALRWKGSRYAAPRHQTAEAMMDWSYALLSDTDQRVFRGLSVFSGEFSLDSAIAMMEYDDLEHADIIESIGNLIDKSLLSIHPGEGPALLKLAGIARSYAAFKLLGSGEREPIEQRQLLHHAHPPQRCGTNTVFASEIKQAMQIQAS